MLNWSIISKNYPVFQQRRMEGCDCGGDKVSNRADDESIFWLQLQTPCDLPILTCCARNTDTSLCWTPLGTPHNTHQKQAAAPSVNMKTRNKHQPVMLYNCGQCCVLEVLEVSRASFPGCQTCMDDLKCTGLTIKLTLHVLLECWTLQAFPHAPWQ